jgi:hypothetical protein
MSVGERGRSAGIEAASIRLAAATRGRYAGIAAAAQAAASTSDLMMRERSTTSESPSRRTLRRTKWGAAPGPGRRNGETHIGNGSRCNASSDVGKRHAAERGQGPERARHGSRRSIPRTSSHQSVQPSNSSPICQSA